ncbi:hypothetical protein [Lignipirellula cremea]|uniref:Uncharacterized protein n=1 Tax=Lignipirellula cremea TaxID=2528010 RepID=A0A518E237_9BACT|nr:hypothetical protein [Lignipirellula cremea]QDU98122.1 hypothetical protein Pla8534_59830 [Lignipirellula cremea]
MNRTINLEPALRIAVLAGSVLASAWLGTNAEATGQEVRNPDIGNDGYDALDAGRDAYQYHEALRRSDFSRQLGLNEQLRYQAAWPWTSWSRLEAAYADPYGYGYGTGYRSGYPYGVLAPQAFVPGDIWGYPYNRPVPQSTGQRQVQTGPNRWESYPLYDTQPNPNVEPAPTPRNNGSRTDNPRRTVFGDDVGPIAPPPAAKKLWDRLGPA